MANPALLHNWEKKLASIFPGWMATRAQARARMFRYIAAQPSRQRPIAPSAPQNPESSTYQRDRIRLIWEARDMRENTVLGGSITTKVMEYGCGKVRYLPRTGDLDRNKIYADFIAERSKKVDVTGRLNLGALGRLALATRAVDGDCGFLVCDGDDKGTVALNPIEGDRIGNPMETMMYSPNYVSGFHLDDRGKIAQVDIVDRNDSSYVNKRPYPGNQFLHFANRMRFDSYRGTTMFYSVLSKLRDLGLLIDYEMASSKWASSLTGMVIKNAGLATVEEEDFFADGGRTTSPEAAANRIKTVEAGTIEYLNEGEDIKQLISNRPTPAWQGFVQLLGREISTGFNLPFSFTFDSTGLMGTAMRLESAQAQRGFSAHQRDLVDSVLQDWVELNLSLGILAGEIPPCQDWDKGQWLFTAHPSVDIGRESQANLSENRQGLRSGAAICGEDAEDIFEVQEQIAAEAANIVALAKKYDVPVAMIQTLAKEGRADAEPIQGLSSHEQAAADLASKAKSMGSVIASRELAAEINAHPLTERIMIEHELSALPSDSGEYRILKARLSELGVP